MIMRAMLEDVGPRLGRGAPVVSRTISAPIGEGRIAAALAGIQRDFAQVAIGSYPFYAEGGSGVQLVVRGRDGEAVEEAAKAIEAALDLEGVKSSRIAP
jgi:molybdopterin-biosynthesis enzyme MoeA-like protein